MNVSATVQFLGLSYGLFIKLLNIFLVFFVASVCSGCFYLHGGVMLSVDVCLY